MDLVPLNVRAESDPGSPLLVRFFVGGRLPETTQVKITWGDYTESWIDASEEFFSHVYSTAGDYLVLITTDKDQRWFALVTVTGAAGTLPIREEPPLPEQQPVEEEEPWVS